MQMRPVDVLQGVKRVMLVLLVLVLTTELG
jgi:hypothetical protein